MAEDDMFDLPAEEMEEETIYYAREDAGDEKPEKLPSPWALWGKVWLRPASGWDAMLHSALSPGRLASAVFYPMAALAAVSEFADIIYSGLEPHALAALLQQATMVFVSLFMSYFAFVPIVTLLTGKATSGRFNTDFGKCYIMTLMASLALIYALYNIFPFMEAVVAFLPLYTIYMAYQGIGALRVADKTVTPWLAAALGALMLPVAIYKIFSYVMPPVV